MTVRHLGGADRGPARFAYERSADQDAPRPARHPVVVVGAGPVGLSAAIDLARHGVRVVLLDEGDSLSVGSRAICFAQRTLEIWDRLGCGEPVAERGVRWNVGKVFFRDALAYQFDLLPEPGHRRPAFVNLPQYHAERFLVERAAELPNVTLRWRNRVVGVAPADDGVTLDVETPDGPYRLSCDYLVAADGARSTVRATLGLEASGRTFRDRFLIADVRMRADFPPERWFWFDPPFHRNRSVLLHRQPDDVWRIDFQLGWDADPVAERDPERVRARVRALLGADVPFELVWVSVYTFGSQRLERFRHGRVLFVGDAAHVMSPFGARGANSGVQDADNLAWKLALVLDGRAPDALLDSYDEERVRAADENLRHSNRSTDFITPKGAVSRAFRDAVLELSREHPFARRLVNSGRLSTPTILADSSLHTPDEGSFDGPMIPGTPAADAPVRPLGGAARGEADGWLLSYLGDAFVALLFVDGPTLTSEQRAALRELAEGPVPVRAVLVVPPGGPAASGDVDAVVVADRDGFATRRYDARAGTCYLLRPDQHVCARWRALDTAAVRAAVARATCAQPALVGEAA